MKEGVETALSLLSAQQLSTLQAKIFKEIGEWLTRQASAWKTTLGEKNNVPNLSGQNESIRSSKAGRMVPPPESLAQWANDAFRYCSHNVCEQARSDYDPSTKTDDFVFLSPLCHLVLKVDICATSPSGELIKNAVRQYYISLSQAGATPRWGYVLPTFPFKNVIGAGGSFKK